MYLTREDLLAFMPGRAALELTCDDPYNMPEEPDMAIIDAALLSAQELIDGYLRGRYTLPLAETPTIVRDLARVISRYRLYERRPESGMPETVAETWKNAVRTLEQIRAGRITLGLPQDATPVPEPGEHRMYAPRKLMDDSMSKAYAES